MAALSEQDWEIRLFIYNFFVEQTRPPSIVEAAQQFGLSQPEAQLAYHRLHDAHTIFLNPGTDNIRMANPLSAIPTDYRVLVNGKYLWANCAWDSLGIPAMMHADATIEAVLPISRERVTYAIEGDTLHADEAFVHFSLPFSRWYDDLVDT